MLSTLVLLQAAGALTVLYLVALKPLYNVLFHPLRAIPGPLLWRMSTLPRSWALCRGRLVFEVRKHHEKYGDVIRLGPNEIAFRQAEAWKDIYGHRAAGEEENPKSLDFYQISDNQPKSLIATDRSQHGELRRLMSHGFSERSMRGQEPIIGSYVDLLVQRLHEKAHEGPLNMREWYNWTTFDIIGNLGFGSDFECLKNCTYHPWTRLITDSVKIAAWFQSLGYMGFRQVAGTIMDIGAASITDLKEMARRKMMQRIEIGKKGERPDLIEGLINKNLPIDTLSANASLLIVAGSETTATLLSGATFLLTSNPAVLEKLTREVRTTFEKKEDITLLSVNNLPYMLSCLNETLRRYPPVAFGLPRVAPTGGVTVAGVFVPEGTSMSVWQLAINHRPDYWTEPYEYIPERWTGKDERFINDKLDAMQPFSIGPRNCIGRNLAYAEMRLILARILFDFDMSLAEDSRDWMKQDCYSLWDKPNLNVHLKPVVQNP
ncbi:Cytochrome P450 monooxygenase 1 [Paramyrothecium foliicola]|nr:Cytochrome P450 monooxygenase 1 [Paramyrothecium foliicola]